MNRCLAILTVKQTVNSLQCDVNTGISQVINIEKYSKYSKLLRVTAYVLRFIDNCRNKTKLTNVLTSAELERAERRWLKSCQENTYLDEITSLKSNKPTRLPLVKQLCLFVDITVLFDVEHVYTTHRYQRSPDSHICYLRDIHLPT